MRPRSLLVVRPSLTVGGADRVTLTLLRALDRARFAPRLALLRGDGPLLAEVPADVPIEVLGARNVITAAAPLRRLIRRERPDIVLSTSSGTNITAALAISAPRPRLVLSERNGLIRDQPAHKLWPFLLAKRLTYPRADCVVAVSAGVASDLRRRLGLGESQVQIAYNPVVTEDLEERAAAAVQEPWFEDAVPVLLAAGRLVHAKGFDLLLDAVARVRREVECRLLLLGEGPLRHQLATRASELCLAAVFKAPGFVANPYSYMRRCSLFVLASRFEGLPGVLIQAMACGAPVVAADCPFGPAEIVRSGVDGMLVPPNDSASLAAAILALLKDPSQRRAMAEAGRASARRFTLENIMPNYVRALDPEGE